MGLGGLEQTGMVQRYSADRITKRTSLLKHIEAWASRSPERARLLIILIWLGLALLIGVLTLGLALIMLHPV